MKSIRALFLVLSLCVPSLAVSQESGSSTVDNCLRVYMWFIGDTSSSMSGVRDSLCNFSERVGSLLDGLGEVQVGVMTFNDSVYVWTEPVTHMPTVSRALDHSICMDSTASYTGSTDMASALHVAIRYTSNHILQDSSTWNVVVIYSDWQVNSNTRTTRAIHRLLDQGVIVCMVNPYAKPLMIPPEYIDPRYLSYTFSERDSLHFFRNSFMSLVQLLQELLPKILCG
jgi:hypothetical protein